MRKSGSAAANKASTSARPISSLCPRPGSGRTVGVTGDVTGKPCMSRSARKIELIRAASSLSVSLLIRPFSYSTPVRLRGDDSISAARSLRYAATSAGRILATANCARLDRSSRFSRRNSTPVRSRRPGNTVSRYQSTASAKVSVSAGRGSWYVFASILDSSDRAHFSALSLRRKLLEIGLYPRRRIVATHRRLPGDPGGLCHIVATVPLSPPADSATRTAVQQ